MMDNTEKEKQFLLQKFNSIADEIFHEYDAKNTHMIFDGNDDFCQNVSGEINFEPLESCVDALHLMRNSVNHSKAVLIYGPVGCGKSFLVQYLAEMAGENPSPHFVTLQMGEHVDGKTLLGTYQCAEIPGQFTWIMGPVARAMREGHWLLLEDLNCAPLDAMSTLASVVESRSIYIPGRGTITAHPNFRLFATIRTDSSFGSAGFSRGDRQFIFNQNWIIVPLQQFTDEEAAKVVVRSFPNLSGIINRLLEVYRLAAKPDVGRNSRNPSFRDLLKFAYRLNHICDSIENPVAIFQEAIDCFVSHCRKNEYRYELLNALAAKLNVNKDQANYYFQIHKPSVQIERDLLSIGRVNLPRKKSSQSFRNECLAFTRPTCVLLEQLAVCVNAYEPVLLVGETGCGKTSAVQFLARQTGSKLHVVNMSQQSENSDLTGGFKPTDLKFIAISLKDRYVELFGRTFSLEDNEKFLTHVQNCLTASRWTALVRLMNHTGARGTQNVDKNLSLEWISLMKEIDKFDQIYKNCGDGLAFSFVEGVLTKALKNGDWILLDEINLASGEALDCLYTLLDRQSRNLVAFDQQNSLQPLSVHPDFRLFACMNPSGDVGKKELPVGIRNRFTEIFVSEPESREDLSVIVHSYLGELCISAEKANGIVEFYVSMKAMAQGGLSSVRWPFYSLRTLCRALAYARTNPHGNVVRSLYEAFCLSFLTELDQSAYQMVEKMIRDHIVDRNPEIVKRLLKTPLPHPSTAGNFVKVEGYWLKKGPLETSVDERYVLTETVKKNLRDLARAVSAKNYPILLQGETSVGKTSLITHLAKLTGNKCVRINNHEHTDIQEYVGTYLADENDKLKFVEGPLVKAMRNGEWIILDELNLSPPDILEALNRLLDDNRELFITETQEMVSAHPDFILFATQNPPGAYGGRKVLSRAFRYRFVELHFNELPLVELEIILQRRCRLPASYAKKMVKVMHDLQIYRSTSGVFVGRESYMTLRDLFRWGERYRLAPFHEKDLADWDQYLVDQGYLLLGGRARREEDEFVICQVLQTHFSRQASPEKIFDLSSPYRSIIFPSFSQPVDVFQSVEGFEHVVWTLTARRLAVLCAQALQFNEPLLAIGETGCGKTTLCQLFASLQKKTLRIINCHLMTEAADFLGRLAPVSSEKRKSGRLFEWRDGPLVAAMAAGSPILIDEISLADDSVLERLNSVLEPERSLLLAEKGLGADGSNAMIFAVDGFALMATMNPGGDYGKKELSRALRNRFTEIWCKNVMDENDFINVVERNISSKIEFGNQVRIERSGFGKAIFDFISWFMKNCPAEMLRLVTMRDISDWVKFINRCSNIMPSSLAYVHGAIMIILNGLGGSNVIGDRKYSEDIRFRCIEFLIRQAKGRADFEFTIDEIFGLNVPLYVEGNRFGMRPFFIEQQEQQHALKSNSYSFETPGCRKNLFRLLRAMQLDKPILLEGSPGVGKTSLVVALAKATGHQLTRINLSEQTDLSDLFGTDLPLATEDGEQKFDWVDGAFLAALKNGHWILIDEMNLASQSVLEGLNACFDHRGEIYVPEIDRTFKVDARNTRFFACQNPHSQGSNRKGLPKSFLNRFSVIVVDPLSAHDQEHILIDLYPAIDREILRTMIELNDKVFDAVTIKRLWGHSGSPWEFNLRDLMRWCELAVNENRHPVCFADLIYEARFRTADDRHQFRLLFNMIFPDYVYESSLQMSLDDTYFQVGDAFLDRQAAEISSVDDLKLCRSMLRPLRYLMHCVKRHYLAILVGPSAIGKTSLVKTLAALCGQNLRTFYLTSDSDSSELLGSFEQSVIDKEMADITQRLVDCLSGNEELIALAENLATDDSVFEKLEAAVAVLKNDELLKRVLRIKADWTKRKRKSKKLQFAWIDSPLVEALKNGDWILMENVNYCSAAVLDRLNALLEPGGELVVSERGFIDHSAPIYRAHHNFRIFYTMDPGYGSISRAMRNRGIEICLLDDDSWLRDPYDSVSILSLETKNLDIAKQVLEKINFDGHIRFREVLQSAFAAREEQNSSTVLSALEKVDYEVCVPIQLALEHHICVAVVRDIVQLVQTVRAATCEFSQAIFALKHYFSLSSKDDFQLRVALCDWLFGKYNNELTILWTNLRNRFMGFVFRKGFSNDCAFDIRWNGELANRLSSGIDFAVLNRRFVAMEIFWILDVHVISAQQQSLYGISKNSKIDDDIETPVKLITKLFDCLSNYFCQNDAGDKMDIFNLDEEVARFLYRLHVFVRTACADFSSMDTDLIRLYWMWLYACLMEFLLKISSSFASVLMEITSTINTYWGSEPIDCKCYEIVIHRFCENLVLRNAQDASINASVARCVRFLNDAFFSAISKGQQAVENQLSEIQLSILDTISSKDIGRMEKIEEILERLFGETAESQTVFFCRRDILKRQLSLLTHTLSKNGRIDLSETNLLAPFGAIFSNVDGNSLSNLLELLQHVSTPLNSDGILETDRISLRASHLLELPLESAVVGDLFRRNVQNGNLKTSISQIGHFSKIVDELAAHFWRFGIFAGSLEKLFLQKCDYLINSVCENLRTALNDFPLSKSMAEAYEIISGLRFNYDNTENIDTWYDQFADLGIALCVLSTPPINSIDPMVKNRVRKRWLQEQVQLLEFELDTINSQYEITTGRRLIAEDDRFSIELTHPYAIALMKLKITLREKMRLTNKSDVYRPKNSQFNLIGRKFRDFLTMTSVCFNDFRATLHRNSGLLESERNALLSKMQSWLKSSEHFQRDAVESHPAYPDIIAPFLLGLNLLQFVINRKSLELVLRNENSGNKNASRIVQRFFSLSPQVSCAPEFFDIPFKESFALLSNFINTIHDDRTREKYVIQSLNYLLDSWTNRVKKLDTDSSTYEYKSKAPLEVEKQEEEQMRALFRMPSLDENSDDTDFQPIVSKIEDEIDENWYAKNLKFLHEFLIGGQSIKEIFDWTAYESALKLSKFSTFPFADCDRNSTIAAHLLALDHVKRRLETSRFSIDGNTKACRKKINVYEECILEEITKFRYLVAELIEGVNRLLTQWPENEVLAFVRERAQAVLELPASSSIMKLAVHLEKLIVDADQWESIAARNVKLDAQLRPLRSLLLEWRKMEISSWENLLDDAETKFFDDGCISVLHYGIVWKAWQAESASDEHIIRATGQLFETSSLGEFDARVRCVNFFVDSLSSEGLENVNKRKTLTKIRNIISYFSQYSPVVHEVVKKQREPIEKEMQEFLKIVKFQDLNICSIQTSAAKAHRQLFRFVKKYKEGLGESMRSHTDILPTPKSDFSIEIPSISSLSERSTFAVENFDSSPESVLEILPKISSFYDRLSNLAAELRKTCDSDYSISTSSLNEVSGTASEIMDIMKKHVPYAGTDEEKMKLFKRTMAYRQKMVSSFFEELTESGFSYRKGAALDDAVLTGACFALDLDQNRSNFYRKISEETLKFYWSCMSRKTAFDSSRAKPHEQIATGVSQRCSGFAQQMTNFLKEMENGILAGANSLDKLKTAFDALKNFRMDADNGAVVDLKNGEILMKSTEIFLFETLKDLETTREIWKCCPDENSVSEWKITNAINDVSPILCKLSSKSEEYLEAMNIVDGLCAKLAENASEFKRLKCDIERYNGFMSRMHFDTISALSSSALSITSDVEKLLELSSTVDSNLNPENLLNFALLRVKNRLREHAEVTANIFSKIHKEGQIFERQQNEILQKADGLVKKILLATQGIYEKICMSSSEKEELPFDILNRHASAVPFSKIEEISSSIFKFLINWNPFFESSQIKRLTLTLEGVLDCFVFVVENQFNFQIRTASEFFKTYSTTIDFWSTLWKHGYVEPIPVADNSGKDSDGKTDFKDIENAGMGEGEGMKDVSDQITDLGQIEGTKGDKPDVDANEEEQRKMDDVDKPIDLDDDFDARLEDIKNDEDEKENEDENDENQEPDADWQKGEAEEPHEEQLDPKIWDAEQQKRDDLPSDDSAKGADKMDENLAAKDDRAPEEHGEQNTGEEQTVADQENAEENNAENDTDFDLENLNLDNDGAENDNEDSGDENNDSNMPEEIVENEMDQTGEEETAGEEETPGDAEEKMDEAEELSVDQGQIESANDGHAGEQQDTGLDSNARPCGNDASTDDVGKNASTGVQQSENDPSHGERQDSTFTPNDAFGDVTKRRDQKSKRRSAQQNQTEKNKRRRTSDDKKTVGSREEPILDDAEMEQNDEEDAENSKQDENQADEKTFSHRPDLGPDAAQMIDSSTVETARKQQPEDVLKSILKNSDEEKEKRKMDEDEMITDRDENLDSGNITDQKKIFTVEEEDKNEPVESEMMDESRATTTTFHTVMDFYSRASNVNFEELLRGFQFDRSNLENMSPDEKSKALWFQYLSVTERLALELTENLRLVLEPTMASKLQGDYRSGKRLNVRKLIPYIASHFRKNKIWLRRTKKAKRDYQILLAVDDSSSMHDNKSMELAFESLALLSTALRHLEVGRLGVCKFGEKPTLLHAFDSPFVETSGANVIGQLNFDQKKTNIAQLLDFVAAYFDEEDTATRNRNDALPARLLLIVSDGRGIFAEGADRVKAAIQKALTLNIFIVFIILDNVNSKHSILDIKVPVFAPGGSAVEIKPYMEFFPFSFYIILRQVQTLPAVMGEALRQWFEMVVSQS